MDQIKNPGEWLNHRTGVHVGRHRDSHPADGPTGCLLVHRLWTTERAGFSGRQLAGTGIRPLVALVVKVVAVGSPGGFDLGDGVDDGNDGGRET